MKKLFLISSLLLSMTMAFSQPDSTASILGQWTNTDQHLLTLLRIALSFMNLTMGAIVFRLLVMLIVFQD